MNSFELSNYVWDKKEDKQETIHKRKSQSIFPCYKKMHVMSKPKVHIFLSKERLLNKRNEIILKCRHENQHKRSNYKS